MLILAIDSATPTASVALAEDGRILYEAYVNYKKTHSETLMPMVKQALDTCEKKLADCTALAVTIGPGSFTGLRIGLAAVKALAVTQKIPVVGISTLELIAHNASGAAPQLVAPLLDARKQEVYTAFYEVGGENLSPKALTEETACSPETFIESAKHFLTEKGYSRIVLAGDGIAPYAETLKAAFGDAMATLPPYALYPRASVLADLARIHLEKDPEGTLDILHAKPVYLRLSEAETRLGKGEL